MSHNFQTTPIKPLWASNILSFIYSLSLIRRAHTNRARLDWNDSKINQKEFLWLLILPAESICAFVFIFSERELKIHLLIRHLSQCCEIKIKVLIENIHSVSGGACDKSSVSMWIGKVEFSIVKRLSWQFSGDENF
jgi:hypothetical protein